MSKKWKDLEWYCWKDDYYITFFENKQENIEMYF